MERVIIRERIKPKDSRLGRNINHDSKSKRFLFDTSNIQLVSAKHIRRIPVLDQGHVGSCTGNAGIGCLGTEPFYISKRKYSYDEQGAINLYSDCTSADSYPGAYLPEDTGSDGLTVGKVLTSAGEINGYLTTLNLNDALKALTVRPFITGTYWKSNMFQPDADGRVHPTGAIEGGHEYVADELIVEKEQIWFTNSWGNWGVNGRFYMTFNDYGELLAQDGDVTIFVPRIEPPPTPQPDADSVFANVLRNNNWVNKRHVGDNGKVANAGRVWLRVKG